MCSVLFLYHVFRGELYEKNISVLLIEHASVLTFTQAFAATKTWAGGAGTGLNWTNTANWGGYRHQLQRMILCLIQQERYIFNNANRLLLHTILLLSLRVQ